MASDNGQRRIRSFQKSWSLSVASAFAELMRLVGRTRDCTESGPGPPSRKRVSRPTSWC